MARSLLAKSVTGNADDGYTFICPVNDGSCGTKDEDGVIPFASTGWHDRKTAEARGQEHFDDHKGIRPMSSLDEFRAKHGLSPSADGQRALVTAKDL